MKRCLHFCLFFLIGSFSLNAQVCNYIVYDGFDYLQNSPLNALSGGTGWLNTWSVQNGNTQVPGFQSIPGSLSFGNLQTTGGSGSGGSSYLTAGRRLNNTSGGPFNAYLVNNDIGAAGTTLYMSVVLQKNQNNNQPVWISLHNNNIDWCNNCASTQIQVGYFGSSSLVGGVRKWGLSVNGTVLNTNETVLPGVATLMILRFNFANPTTIDYWVNPPSIGNSNPMPTLSYTAASSLAFRSLALYLGDGTNQGRVDEIRFASSFSCTVPDQNVIVNTPPNAIIGTNTQLGVSPLNVQFDGSGSYDLNGNIVQYEWQFNDGSPAVTAMNTNHTFSALGEHIVTLTVTDDQGIAHTTTQLITVTKADGTIGCLSQVQVVQLPDCSSSNGAIQVNLNSGQNIQLWNMTQNTIPPNGNQFQNLAAGTYTLLVSGSNNCRDTFQLRLPIDSTTCAAWVPNSCELQIGAGLEGISYYANTRTFRDYFKSAGDWIPYDPQAGGWSTNDLAFMPSDTNGYPLQIPYQVGAAQRQVRGILSANGFMQVGVPMRLMYDGTGNIQMQGTVQQTGSGYHYIDFTPSQNGNIWFNLTNSDVQDPVRNIRVVELSDTLLYLSQPFRQNFLDKCAMLKALRFMDWQHTNNNGLVQWSQRTSASYYTQSRDNGVAYEYIVALANAIKRDIWICIPHQADDNYITQMAQFFKAHLHPGIHVYLEYSNEVWNWLFQQTHWVNNHGPQNLSLARRYTERSIHAFRVWNNAWGSDVKRVKRVLGTQLLNDAVHREILAHAPPSDYDYLSPSFYFGVNHYNGGNPDLSLLGINATVNDILNNATNSFLSVYPNWRNVYQDCKLFGKEIVNYEGGQHFTDFSVPPYINAMYAAQLSSGMYQLYNRVLDSLRRLDSKLAMAFVLCGPNESIYGSWGHLTNIDDPAPWNDVPKFQVLVDNLHDKPSPYILGSEQASLCQNQSYNIALPQMGHSYQWQIVGGDILYGQGTDSIVVAWRQAGTQSIACSEQGLSCAEHVVKNVQVDTCSSYLTVRTFLESYHDQGQNMQAVLMNQLVAGALSTDCDTVVLQLHPMSNVQQVFLSDTSILQTNGWAGFRFPNINDWYYISLKHRNHIQTFSQGPVRIHANNEMYDFSLQASQAYGSNQTQIAPGLFALYSGDINQDGVIDGLDYNDWETDSNNFSGGYFNTDLNGDGIVDGLDFIYWEQNSNNFVGAVAP